MDVSKVNLQQFQKLCNGVSLIVCTIALVLTISFDNWNPNITWAILFSSFIITPLPRVIQKNKKSYLFMAFGIVTTLYFTIASFF